MANTYCQIYVHFVFAVQNRMGLIKQAWKDDLLLKDFGIEYDERYIFHEIQ